MATLKQIRQRIRTAKNIQQITKAMKLVAAARLKKATDRVLEARPYSEKLREMIQLLSQGKDSLPSSTLMVPRASVKKVGILMITADRGLAGGYNTNLLRKGLDFAKSFPAGTEVEIIAVGKKGLQFFSKRGYPIVDSFTIANTGPTLDDVQAITDLIEKKFVDGELDEIYAVYSKFYSAIRQTPQSMKLLPIEPPAAEEGEHSHNLDFEFEPDANTLMEALLPRYLLTLVWQALLEATASEHGARMTAMTSATDNAGKMIEDLTLKANRERQASITKQIMEIVGGAEALKG
ncbi:MAG: ATP synthase F1 subunit gamma [Fimbriimonadaceae bacterium]